jgi:type II secretory pathway component PulF
MIGKIIIWNTTARFSRTMANLLKSGILLADAMKIVVNTLTNTRMRDDVIETRKKLLQGQAFSASMSSSNLFVFQELSG